MLIGFARVTAAADCVAAIIGTGIIPAAIKLMDRGAIHAAEAFVRSARSRIIWGARAKA